LKLDLTKCVRRRSWLVFNLPQKEEEQIDWLHASAENWENTTGFCKMEEIERAFEVVNDCAEPLKFQWWDILKLSNKVKI